MAENLLCMTIRLSVAQKKMVIKRTADIAAVLHETLQRKSSLRQHYEYLWVVGLNNANKLQFMEITALGRFNVENTSPAAIFQRVIQKKATKLVLVQYNPRGNLMPLPDDRDMAIRMVKAGELLGIGVIDYLIISEKEYLSFAEKEIVEEFLADKKRQNGKLAKAERIR